MTELEQAKAEIARLVQVNCQMHAPIYALEKRVAELTATLEAIRALVAATHQ